MAPRLVTAGLSDSPYLIPVGARMSTRSQISEVTLVNIISYQAVDMVLVTAPKLVLSCDWQKQIVSMADASWRLLWINSSHRLQNNEWVIGSSLGNRELMAKVGTAWEPRLMFCLVSFCVRGTIYSTLLLEIPFYT